jgi:hypothetical protein
MTEMAVTCVDGSTLLELAQKRNLRADCSPSHGNQQLVPSSSRCQAEAMARQGSAGLARVLYARMMRASVSRAGARDDR